MREFRRVVTYLKKYTYKDRFFKRESKKTVYRVFFDKDLLYSFGVMPSCFLKNKVK